VSNRTTTWTARNGKVASLRLARILLRTRREPDQIVAARSRWSLHLSEVCSRAEFPINGQQVSATDEAACKFAMAGDEDSLHSASIATSTSSAPARR
jgi:hypothetical protein